MSAKQKNRIKRLQPTTWLLIFFGALLMTVALANAGEPLAFDVEPVQPFNDGWVQVDAAGKPVSQSAATLPARFAVTDVLRIEKTVPQQLVTPAVLGFRTAHQKVRMYCDGDLIYSFGYDNPPGIGKSPGSAYNIVRLPQDSEGKKLVLELESPYSAYRGNAQEVFLGSKAALLFHLLRSHTLSLLITVVIFVVGIVTLVVDALVIRKEATIGKETYYLGLFAVFVSLWMFGEGRLIQLFHVPPAVNTCATFLAMLATPIPLVRYIACGRSAQNQRLLTWVSRALSGLLVVSVCLQLFGVMDFIEQLPFVHAGLILSCLALLWAVVSDALRRPTAEQYRLMGAMVILMFCFVMELIWLYRGGRSIGNIMRVGVLIFIAIQAQTAFKNATHMLQMSRLASTDALTGCLNRTAYTQRLQEMQGQRDVGLVIVDINDLKYINDTYGHETGDDAIVRCSRCFSEAFSAGGSCFRIGGDEFVMLGKNLSPQQLSSMEAAFAAKISAESGKTTYPFSASCGTAMYDGRCDETVSDTLARADHLMYQGKRDFKKNPQET